MKTPLVACAVTSLTEIAGARRRSSRFDRIWARMRTLTHLFAALALLSPTVDGVVPPPDAHQSGTSTPVAQPDVQRLGPQVSHRVPDFTLVDQDGRQRSLQSLMGEKGLILVFSRSADW